MSLSLSTAARTAMVAALADLIDGGSGAGVIRVYTGSKPAGPGSAATGTLLLEFTLSDPAFPTRSAGVATLDVDPIPSDEGIADGTAGWFRALDSTEAGSTGLGVIDGTVTATGGGGDLTLNTVSITTGLVVEITSGTITVPAS